LKSIREIANTLGLDYSLIEPFGNDKAKVPLSNFPTENINGQKSHMVVVTAITPTPSGEGKSTTAVGLTQGLGKVGRRPVLTIRQPSLGPVFGHKGGGTGGGRATVQPSVDINLHFTGDFHAVESAHNLLGSMVDNSVYRKQIDGFTPQGITWRRVTDAEDRALRSITTGLGGKLNSPLRETGFDISAASEIMAICALATSYSDLRNRLENIVVGWTEDRRPVLAKETNSVGSMMALLKDALKPNLVQTSEGQPAFVHMGPFGNIAHGCSSIIADQLASQCGDYVITEAGFGADLGFEKFMDIKVRQGGKYPKCAVIVTTVKGLKWHGGISLDDINSPNNEAIKKGSENLRNAIRIVKLYGLPSVVAINKFPNDKPDEIELIKQLSKHYGAEGCEESSGFMEGGIGMTALAEAVSGVCETTEVTPNLLYEDNASIIEKVDIMSKTLYKASEVKWGRTTKTTAKLFTDNDWYYPICMAKTHLSISADPKLRGAPTGHVLPINDLKILGGAKQIVTMAGGIITLPGLPSNPNAVDIDLTEEGNITGILGA
jgi:formate--tetrahydrofolate ligase